MGISEKWVVRFKLKSGHYTFTRISRNGNPLERDEVEEWADHQIRLHNYYDSVDEVYPDEGRGHE